MAVLVLLVVLPGSLAAEQPPQRKTWRPVGRLDPERVKEPSGIIRSRRHAGVFWTHGDSGTRAAVFAFTENGELLAEISVAKVVNIDWEDIAVDRDGNLCVGEIGNYRGLLPVRYVYVIPEPDPHAKPASPATVTKRIKYKYLDERFNAESLFVRGDDMFVISVGLGGARPTLYRLAPQSDTESSLEKVQELPMFQARGADVSADGRRLAVCTPGSVVVIDLDDEGRIVPNRKPARVTFPHSAMEACCFDGDDVVLLNEAGEIYRVSKEDLAANTGFVAPARPATRAKPRP